MLGLQSNIFRLIYQHRSHNQIIFEETGKQTTIRNSHYLYVFIKMKYKERDLFIIKDAFLVFLQPEITRKRTSSPRGLPEFLISHEPIMIGLLRQSFAR